ncbi:MAG: potassium channel protein [Bacteroidales bacterium]|nr:potassium channel protein [Bacteroidales bacterium]MCF8404789.1 potassium channel protein [Bacteroidales bacterium]
MERLTSRQKILIGLGMITGILIIGVTGYMVIEGDSWLNALYMTVITISTVGFGEVHKLSPAGKIFTMFLIISSFTTYAYALTTISTHFFEGQLKFFLRGYGTKTIKKMNNHIVICGFGRNGHQVAKELKAFGHQYVVIDQSEKVLLDGFDQSAGFVKGDATQDEVLIQANVKTAKGLITTLPVDADNLYVALTARALNPDLEIISRAADENSETKLRMAGVNNVVMPERVGGAHMASLIARPDILEFLDHVSVHGQDPTTLEEITCDEIPEDSRTQTIHEIGIRKITGANIIGYKTPDGRYILNPTPNTQVVRGSKLFVLGTPAQINKMKEILRAVQ